MNAKTALAALEQTRADLAATLPRDADGKLTREGRDTLDAWDEEHASQFVALQNAPKRSFRFELGLDISSGVFSFAPVQGRRSLYISLTIGRRSFWVQRWDTERCDPSKPRFDGKARPVPFAYSRDRLMCWTCGTR